MKKNLFMASVGLVLFSGTIALSSFLVRFGVLGPEELIASVLSLVPIFFGLVLGNKIRGLISQKTFEYVLSIVMAVIGTVTILRSF